jgi:hypothetical protein
MTKVRIQKDMGWTILYNSIRKKDRCRGRPKDESTGLLYDYDTSPSLLFTSTFTILIVRISRL